MGRAFWRIGAFAAVLLGAVPTAHAGTFCLQSYQADGLDEASAVTFQQLLAVEVRSRESEFLTTFDTESCDALVDVVVGRLGERIVVTMIWSGTVNGESRASAETAAELEPVAARLATELVAPEGSEPGPRLGEITDDIGDADRRSDIESGFQFGIGAHVPMFESFNNAILGPTLNLGYWGESRHFAIDVRTAFRWSADGDEEKDAEMFLWALDIGAHWMMSPTVVSPYFGGGLGLRYSVAPRTQRESVGTVVIQEQNETLYDNGFGVGIWGRAGVMLLRTYRVRLSVHADIDLTTLPTPGQTVHPALTFGISTFF